MIKRLVVAIGLAAATTAQSAALTVTSSVIKKGGWVAEAQVFNDFGCSGSNVSHRRAPDRRVSDEKCGGVRQPHRQCVSP